MDIVINTYGREFYITRPLQTWFVHEGGYRSPVGYAASIEEAITIALTFHKDYTTTHAEITMRVPPDNRVRIYDLARAESSAGFVYGIHLRGGDEWTAHSLKGADDAVVKGVRHALMQSYDLPTVDGWPL